VSGLHWAVRKLRASSVRLRYRTALVGGLSLEGDFGGMGHGMFFHREVEFSTCHSFCSHCSFKLRMKRTFAELVEKLSFAILLIGLLAFVVGLVFAPFVLFKHPGKRELLVSLIQLGGGAAAILCGWWGTTTPRRRTIPSALKRISRRPFVLKAVSFSD
jgi:hypothetical protein